MNSTTQRPTPETDAATLCLDCDDSCVEIYTRNQDGSKYEGDVCRSDKMAKLERERDEAREELEAMREAIRFTLANHNIDPEACIDKLQPFLKP